MASRPGAAGSGAVNSALANRNRNTHGGGSSQPGSSRPNSVLQEAGQMKVSNNSILNVNKNGSAV